MPEISAGLLMYRRRGNHLQVLLVHPGGPFWRNKDAGAWSIPKGKVNDGEELLTAAKREFQEETGAVATGQLTPLKSVRQKSGKIVHAWAVDGDFDPVNFKSNTFIMEWPLKSGKQAEFPEVDRAEFFDIETARKKILPAQAAFLDALISLFH